jgi:DNA-directed RNA polymerase specialized sigma24 family protein
MSRHNLKNQFRDPAVDAVGATTQSPHICGAAEDRRLVEQCLAGDEAAWDELYRRHHPILLRIIKALLFSKTGRADLVEEIAARVWFSLVSENGRRLGLYDAGQGCRLITFLAAMARNEILQHIRAERRRRIREQFASQPESVSPLLNDWQGKNLVEEFVKTLTPREREFFRSNLLNISSDAPNFTTSNSWQLKHRVHRKLKFFIRDV